MFKLETFFKAEAKIRTATEIPIMNVIACAAPANSPLILLNMDKAPIISPNNIVIAVRDDTSFLESINDSTKRDAANIPIAIAIF